MSDFINQGWAHYVAIVTGVSIFACLALLFIASKRKLRPGEDPNKPETTGHVWDGDLTELNNPLPRW